MTRALVIACLAALGAGAARAETPGLVHDTRFAIEVTLAHHSGGSVRQSEGLRLEGIAGEPIVGRTVVGTEFTVEMRVVGALDARHENAVLAIEALVRPRTGPALTVARDVVSPAERVRFVELWRGSDARERLVASIVTRWDHTPRAAAMTTTEPVAVTVELREDDATLERHELPTVIGRDVVFELTRSSTAADAAKARLVVTPKARRADRLDVSARLTVLGATGGEPYTAEARDLLDPGGSLVLPLPDVGDGHARTVVVTIHQ